MVKSFNGSIVRKAALAAVAAVGLGVFSGSAYGDRVSVASDDFGGKGGIEGEIAGVDDEIGAF